MEFLRRCSRYRWVVLVILLSIFVVIVSPIAWQFRGHDQEIWCLLSRLIPGIWLKRHNNVVEKRLGNFTISNFLTFSCNDLISAKRETCSILINSAKANVEEKKLSWPMAFEVSKVDKHLEHEKKVHKVHIVHLVRSLNTFMVIKRGIYKTHLQNYHSFRSFPPNSRKGVLCPNFSYCYWRKSTSWKGQASCAARGRTWRLWRIRVRSRNLENRKKSWLCIVILR